MSDKTEKKGETLEDLASLFTKQVQNSDWLKEHTPEKWISENKELYEEIQEQYKKIDSAMNQSKSGTDKTS